MSVNLDRTTMNYLLTVSSMSEFSLEGRKHFVSTFIPEIRRLEETRVTIWKFFVYLQNAKHSHRDDAERGWIRFWSICVLIYTRVYLRVPLSIHLSISPYPLLPCPAAVDDGLCNAGNWSDSSGRVIIFCRVEQVRSVWPVPVPWTSRID